VGVFLNTVEYTGPTSYSWRLRTVE